MPLEDYRRMIETIPERPLLSADSNTTIRPNIAELEGTSRRVPRKAASETENVPSTAAPTSVPQNEYECPGDPTATDPEEATVYESDQSDDSADDFYNLLLNFGATFWQKHKERKQKNRERRAQRRTAAEEEERGAQKPNAAPSSSELHAGRLPAGFNAEISPRAFSSGAKLHSEDQTLGPDVKSSSARIDLDQLSADFRAGLPSTDASLPTSKLAAVGHVLADEVESAMAKSGSIWTPPVFDCDLKEYELYSGEGPHTGSRSMTPMFSDGTASMFDYGAVARTNERDYRRAVQPDQTTRRRRKGRTMRLHENEDDFRPETPNPETPKPYHPQFECPDDDDWTPTTPKRPHRHKLFGKLRGDIDMLKAIIICVSVGVGMTNEPLKWSLMYTNVDGRRQGAEHYKLKYPELINARLKGSRIKVSIERFSDNFQAYPGDHLCYFSLERVFQVADEDNFRYVLEHSIPHQTTNPSLQWVETVLRSLVVGSAVRTIEPDTTLEKVSADIRNTVQIISETVEQAKEKKGRQAAFTTSKLIGDVPFFKISKGWVHEGWMIEDPKLNWKGLLIKSLTFS